MRILRADHTLTLAVATTFTLGACSSQDSDVHQLSPLSDLHSAESKADLLKVPFSDRKEGNLLFKSFSGAIVETNYEQGFHVMERIDSVEEKLKSAGFQVESYQATGLLLASVPSLTSAAARQAMGVAPPAASAASIPNYACYETVEETYAVASDLAAEYPNLARWIDVGDSWNKTMGLGGYDMMVLSLSNELVVAEKPKLFLTCAIHAREYTTAALCLDFAQELVTGHGQDADATWILDHHEVHLMLQANPDGRKEAEAGILWRKNVNENYCSPTSQQRGADLNRNFSFGWNCCNGSSSDMCTQTYRGPSAASEPETQAMQNYMLDLFPDARPSDYTTPAPADTSGLFLDIHSYSGLVLWPWGSTSNQAPNHQQLQTLGRRLAFFNGYSPEQSISLYPTDGTTDDFTYGELGVASYTMEIGTAFFQDCATYENEIRPDNLRALRYAAKVLRTPYITPSGPSTEQLNVSYEAFATALNAEIIDTQFNNQNGTEASQAVVAAEYYVDMPPWQAGATAYALTAVDGAFNTSQEEVQATIDTSELSNGRHIIFVRGKDAADVWGPISAAFIDVENTACQSDLECDDGNYCNGSESCETTGACSNGPVACTGSICDEENDRCVNCLSDNDCSDGVFCNGSETCDGSGQCQPGASACAGSECDEQGGRCVSCLNAMDCDDGIACTIDSCENGECDSSPQNSLCSNGVFCDGAELCEPGQGCVSGVEECADAFCDEVSSRCVECLSHADCDDSVSCTLDTCDEITGSCSTTPQDSLCGNGLFCDGEESCDPQLGCQAGSTPCAVCDEQTDQCEASGCSEDNAADLGARGAHTVIAGDACTKLTQFPSWWQWTSRQAQLQSNGTGNFPIGFTWTQECSGAGGSGILAHPWASTALGAVSENCAVLIQFTGSGNLGVTWY